VQGLLASHKRAILAAPPLTLRPSHMQALATLRSQLAVQPVILMRETLTNAGSIARMSRLDRLSV
jgi:hypothetical protein